jgi:mono/diheme cytochrome c family protein
MALRGIRGLMAVTTLLAGSFLSSRASPQVEVLAKPAELPQVAAPTPAAGESPQVATGRYLAVLGDCQGCHDRPGGAHMAGGLPLNTPFGVIYTANLTPDRETGIGAWSSEDFWNAMHRGVRRDGAKLYPAFPYPYFTHITRAESDALYAYLRSVPAVEYRPPANKLPFPLNIRAVVTVWNWMNFREDNNPNAGGGDPGGHIVQGLGHCGACHTPKTFLGGDKKGQALQGGRLDNWFAPALNSDSRRGLGAWSTADVVEYLKTSRNAHANASGSMAAVVEYSTSLMNETDLAAVATYLKAQPAAPTRAAAAPDAKVMTVGAAIYADQCAACHKTDGSGVPRMFPPLKGAAVTQSDDATTAVRFILAGTQTATTDKRPTAASMPAYAWKLNDAQIAAVSTFIRNSWGNSAPAVRPSDVAGLRKRVAAHPVRKPSATV